MLHFTCRCQIPGLLLIFEKCLALFLPLASATNRLWLITLSLTWSCKWNVSQQLSNDHDATDAYGVPTAQVGAFWLRVWGESDWHVGIIGVLLCRKTWYIYFNFIPVAAIYGENNFIKGNDESYLKHKHVYYIREHVFCIVTLKKIAYKTTMEVLYKNI